MRHPMLRVFQLCCSLALALLAILGIRPTPALAAPVVEVRTPTATDLTVSVLGETENPDGSWTGVDLLRDGGGAERFQLLVQPRDNQRIWIEAVGEDGTHSLFPAPGDSPVLGAGRTYSFPGPGAFYTVKGKIRLQLTTAPLEETPVPKDTPPARVVGNTDGVVAPLSDGSLTTLSSTRFRSRGMSVIEVDLRDRGGLE